MKTGHIKYGGRVECHIHVTTSATHLFDDRLENDAGNLSRQRLAGSFLALRRISSCHRLRCLAGGLPVITCRCQFFFSRVNAILLSAIGCPKSVVSDLRIHHIELVSIQPDSGSSTQPRGNPSCTQPLNADRFRHAIEAAYGYTHTLYNKPKSFCARL
jgi:hypothetical protein